MNFAQACRFALLRKEWSEAAREAALEARRKKMVGHHKTHAKRHRDAMTALKEKERSQAFGDRGGSGWTENSPGKFAMAAHQFAASMHDRAAMVNATRDKIGSHVMTARAKHASRIADAAHDLVTHNYHSSFNRKGRKL